MSIVAGDAPQDPGFALLSLLSDPQRLQARIAEFQAAQQNAQAAIATLGAVNDINAYRADAAADRAKAADELDGAKAAAAATVSEAKIKAKSLVDAAEAKALTITQKAEAVLSQAEQTRAEILAGVTNSKAALDAQTEALAAAQAQADATQRAAATAIETSAAAQKVAEAIKAKYEKRLAAITAVTQGD